ncbi:MAG: DNA translocase FtsK 4TM domain-containing protein [candidate division WOR-3 bacterium]
MAKGKRTKGRRRQPQRISLQAWLKVAGVVIVVTALGTSLSLISPSHGTLTGEWLELLRRGFGWGVYVLPIALAAIGFWLFLRGFDRAPHVPVETALGASLLFLGGLSLLHYFAADPQAVAYNGKGGGHIGWWLSRALISALGDIGALLVLVTAIAIGFIALFSISLANVGKRILTMWQKAQDWYRRWSVARDAYVPPPTALSPAERVSAPAAESAPKAQAAPTTTGATGPATAPVSGERGMLFPRVVGLSGQWQLPKWEDILEDSIDQELSQAEVRTRVRIIEETLASFGVPAKVVEVNQGPTVTQFGVEPGFIEQRDHNGQLRRVKVKVNRISSLANDLALALAASPIRIEAPVPGRSMVGIEVPNTSTSLVSLRSVMDSEAFRKINSKLRIALGQDVAGQPVAADLALMPHLLIAGATGSGKSVCINAITACLLLNNTPDDLRLVMVDPKMVELTNFNGVPHLLVPVVVEIERVVATLKWITSEMDRRYRVFSKAGARNIEAYNQTRSAGTEPLPYIVVLIDELADLMMVAPDDVERSICRIAQLARATGIHLVIATQRPSVDVVTGLIKANFPARISFAVTSHVDSRVILDTPGAERLLGRGDLLYMASDSSKLVRMQGCYISDGELQKLVNYWRGFRTSAPLPPGAALVQQPLWDEILAREKETPGRDDLLDKAIEIVQEQGRASISLLQRKLRIGYSRAARLIDAMEAEGIIGPEEGPGHVRPVYKTPQEASHREQAAEKEP